MKEVYFIFQEGDDTICKIGKTKDLGRRLAQLQTGNPKKLYVYDTLEGYTELENELHERYAHARIGRSEWFKLEKDLVDRIIFDYSFPKCKKCGNYFVFESWLKLHASNCTVKKGEDTATVLANSMLYLCKDYNQDLADQVAKTINELNIQRKNFLWYRRLGKSGAINMKHIENILLSKFQ